MEDREKANEVRRANLRRYVEIHCAGNKATMIKKLPLEAGRDAYWRGVLGNGKKSFSWQKARETEPHLGLLPGELEIESSLLRMDPSRRRSPRDELIAMINRMEPEEHLELLAGGADILRRRPSKPVKEKATASKEANR